MAALQKLKEDLAIDLVKPSTLSPLSSILPAKRMSFPVPCRACTSLTPWHSEYVEYDPLRTDALGNSKSHLLLSFWPPPLLAKRYGYCALP